MTGSSEDTDYLESLKDSGELVYCERCRRLTYLYLQIIWQISFRFAPLLYIGIFRYISLDACGGLVLCCPRMDTII